MLNHLLCRIISGNHQCPVRGDDGQEHVMSEVHAMLCIVFCGI